MNKPIILLLTAMFFSTPLFAQDAPPPPPPPQPANANTHFGWADVLRVDPIYQHVRVEQPQQQCYQQPVERVVRHSNAAGTMLGAIVGGVLGNTIGKGDGRRAATVAGAVAGGAIGNRISNNANGGTQVQQGTVTQCQNVNTVSEERRIVGYSVEYRYHGDIYVSRLDYDPGDRLRIRISVSPVD